VSENILTWLELSCYRWAYDFASG